MKNYEAPPEMGGASCVKGKIKMSQQNTFKIPNQLICEDRLTLSARKLGAVLYARSNPLGYCHKSLAELAQLAGCSVSTVRKAAGELEAAGWLSVSRTYTWVEKLGHRGYGKLEYRITPLPEKGWTQIPRSYLERCADMTPAGFVIGLYLYAAAGNRERRAFPSISKISAAIGVAQRTVCRALHQLSRLKEFLVTHCKRIRGDYAANNYHLCVVLPVAEAAVDLPVCTKQRTMERMTGAQRLGAVLCDFIVRLRRFGRKMFPLGKVMTKLAGIVRT